MLQDEENDDVSDKTLEKMTAIIGEQNQQYTLPLLHLVIADSAYCDANKNQAMGRCNCVAWNNTSHFLDIANLLDIPRQAKFNCLDIIIL